MDALKPKNDPKEATRIAAQMEQLRKEAAQFVCDEEGKGRTLEEKMPNKSAEGVIDTKTYPTVYFKNSKKGTYVINHNVLKIFIEHCEDITVIVNGKILTAVVEAWRCNNLVVQSAHQIKTIQLDLSKSAKFQFSNRKAFGSLVWQGVEGDISLEFKSDESFNYTTNFGSVKARFPDSDVKMDQFMIRYVPEIDEDKLSEERCIRLKNGFLSTDREAEDWDKRNELAKDRHIANFCKEAGINLNKKQGKKIQPNATCPLCDSGRKYKKCCMNKKK